LPAPAATRRRAAILLDPRDVLRDVSRDVLRADDIARFAFRTFFAVAMASILRVSGAEYHTVLGRRSNEPRRGSPRPKAHFFGLAAFAKADLSTLSALDFGAFAMSELTNKTPTAPGR